MDVTYQRDMNHNYMILKCEDGLDEESFETRMIFTNRIPGLLSCHIRYVDDRTYLGYEVTSRQSLALFCENRKPGKRELRNILGSILNTISGLDEYLLGPDHLILDPQFILMNFDTQEAALTFAPFYRKDIRTSLRELAEYLLSFISHDDQQGIVLGYRIYHELLERNAGISELMNILYEKKQSAQDDVMNGNEKEYADTERGPAENRADQGNTEYSGDIVYGSDITGGTYHRSREYVKEKNVSVFGGRKSRKSVKKAAVICAAGVSAALAVYVLLHFHSGIMSETGGNAARVAAFMIICSAALGIGFYFRKSSGACSWDVAGPDVQEEREFVWKTEGERKNTGKKGGAGWYEGMKSERQYAGEMSDERRYTEKIEGYEGYAGNAAEQKAEEAPCELRGTALTGREEIRVTDMANTEDDITVLLTDSGERAAAAALVPEDASAEISAITLADKDMLVGKQSGIVSHVIESPAVSRIHARIRKNGDGYYLRDLNSTNGTTVNGRTVFGDEEVRLTDGDRVMFADAVYIYKS